MNEKSQGIKNIQIHARCAYPIVSAYEFEFLKTEDEVQALLKPCSLYIIAQRPLIFIQNLRSEDGLLLFEIADNTKTQNLTCTFDPRINGFTEDGEDLLIDIQFYKRTPDTEQPFNNVAGIKLWDSRGKFLLWLTPQKFIHHVLTNRLNAIIEGDIYAFIDYKVHYIGQAFSQTVWDRLTGHEKMQSILTMEHPLDHSTSMSSLEISLIVLEVLGFDEANIFPAFDFAVPDGLEPIVYEFDFENENESFENYYCPKLTPKAPELTNEVEAMMVSKFKPAYNKIQFNNYPHIKSGTRSAGYTTATLVLDSLPATLSTETFIQNAILPGEV